MWICPSKIHYVNSTQHIFGFKEALTITNWSNTLLKSRNEFFTSCTYKSHLQTLKQKVQCSIPTFCSWTFRRSQRHYYVNKCTPCSGKSYFQDLFFCNFDSIVTTITIPKAIHFMTNNFAQNVINEGKNVVIFFGEGFPWDTKPLFTQSFA